MESSQWNRKDNLACALMVITAVMLAIAPHLANRVVYGSLEYLSDNDDIVYLAVARAPYYGENSLRDPFSGRWESVPSLYSWMQFVPLAKLTRLVGLPLILNNLVWRAVGGILFGTSTYLIFRRLFKDTTYPTAMALGACSICLADAGLIQGRTLAGNLTFLSSIWNGITPQLHANSLAQYRVVTPLLNLPFLFMLASSLIPKIRRTPGNAALGIVSLGMCVWLYFYFWTAAILGLLLYLILLLLKAWKLPDGRQELLSSAGFIAIILVGGLVVGSWQIINNAHTFADPQYKPILHRLSKGYPLPLGDPLRKMYLFNVWVFIKLIIGGVAALFFRDRGIGLLWCLTFAGYVLANSAIITGLEFENFHWSYVHAALGEIMVFAVVGMCLDRWLANRIEAGRPAKKRVHAAWLVPVSVLAIALFWRPYEALHAPEAVTHSRTLQSLQPLKPKLVQLESDCSLVGPYEVTKVALLFTRSGQLYQDPYSHNVSPIPDDEVHERHALNGWLQGMTEAEYAETARDEHFAGGPFKNPEWDADYIKQRRVSIFRSFSNNVEKALNRYRPCYLLLPANSPAPERGRQWKLMQRSEDWALWQLTDNRTSSSANSNFTK